MIAAGKCLLALIVVSAAVVCRGLTVNLSGNPEGDRLFVSPSGDDAADGSESAPLASMSGARDRIRAMKDEGLPATPVTVYFADGIYEIAEPVIFTTEDSGTSAAPITYKAMNPGKVTISGGRTITGWQQRANGVWAAPVAKDWEFYQLFVDGERRQRARTPNHGYLKSFGPSRPVVNFGALDKSDLRYNKEFRYRNDDLQNWPDLADALVVYFHSWLASLHWVERLDEDQGIVYLRNPSQWPFGRWDNQQGRYYIENVKAAFDAPGEWFLDKAAGELLYRPLPGESTNAVEVIAPFARRLLEFEDVEHLAFEGLSFRYSDWRLNKDDYRPRQAFSNVDSTPIFGRKLRNTRFERCEIAMAGAHAMVLREGCQNNIIRQCHIHNMAGGGVYIGVTTPVPPGTPNEMLSHSNVVDNCFIHDLNHTLHGSVGILVAHASDNSITHNDISEFDYTGISVGWIWTMDHRTNHRRNRIENNRVHHLVKGVLSDGGGIYTTGYYNEGTVIRGNVVHDIHHYPTHNHAKGIYLDGCSSDIVVENNLVYDISGLGIQTKGERNIVRNNIFAFCGMAGISRGRQVNDHMDTFEPNIFIRNLVYLGDAPVLRGELSQDMSALDFNLYWNRETPGQAAVDYFLGTSEWSANRISLDDFRELGQDVNSLVSDPIFKNPERRDFRLKQDSPAAVVGFVPFDHSDAGLYGCNAWTGLPSTLVHRPLETFEIDWSTFSSDFEDHHDGMRPMTGWAVGENDTCTVRVTEERSASGSKSLLFQAGGGAQSWFPNMVIRKPFGEGRYSLSMRIWNDPEHPGAITLGTRSYDEEDYTTCVEVRIRSDGEITAGNRPIGAVPAGEWFELSLSFGGGKNDGQSYDLLVTLTDGTAIRADSVPASDASFDRLDWIGIIASANEGRFYLDELQLEKVKE